MSKIDLSVNIGSLKLKNPVLLASGTVGYGNEISQLTDISKLGGIVTKSLSLKPRKGNPPQRIVETPSGMLNAIGLANVGVEVFIKEKIPFLKELNTTLICNIAASSIEEYVECVKILTSEETIQAFEINVSCPNVREGGLIFGNDLSSVGRITEQVRAATNKPIIIKLSPNVPKIADFAEIVKKEGGDAVSAINTLVGASFDIYTRKPKIKNVTGGLSGPAIKPVAIAKVLEIKRNVDIPIIGLGGIMNWKDAAEFMIVGASAIQVGTANFINPNAGNEIVDGLEEFCSQQKIIKLSEMIGSYQI
ncbi:MAG: dihydroorotate dehydrogenase B catalytic subunit [Stygiobacter sp. RIFOXYC12_FULL_38_8]|nr:MAG: dihydroorotate dehydrogenase B catalytic subunit [Stygiobacter sp. GWC2_38_9]OGV06073.1 MAG: dihydroorotate dehydrogenase B catalytic subunit [Stygiobacter sp. RIFOXYB2_FULL_37_11]OGV10198.1 MAG: dihydroorotate dehydrogenase B catalytic subunit [Stygiobacter sp. RIFOXYA2_FULL_38_8]OGV16863.1 MAG: dihydroorotate dehydrogenase B catalytic subunit [Stygiobacter sp. RIFOXYC2_FULL_38_25]OGV28506.1 MAG: dihydroorotate dehydrogenase B catalytic subunit [Stygiobacter sp. RIFOXYC12_FULL_38_8]OG